MPDSLQLSRLRVVLVATRNSLNIGAAARAMSNFGVLDLRLVRPYDPSFREARSAVGAAALMATAKLCETIAEAVTGCSVVIGTSGKAQRSAHHDLVSLESAAVPVHAALNNGEVALLFGSEKFGLSNDDLSYCNWLLHIPTREEHPSMNLGQAVAVCLYELTCKPVAASAMGNMVDLALAEDRERVTSTLMEALGRSGYLDKRQRMDMAAHIRQMLLRLQLTSRDAQTLLGMLRQMIWKMDSTQNSDK